MHKGGERLFKAYKHPRNLTDKVSIKFLLFNFFLLLLFEVLVRHRINYCLLPVG